jgi:hypothetical protein
MQSDGVYPLRWIEELLVLGPLKEGGGVTSQEIHQERLFL